MNALADQDQFRITPDFVPTSSEEMIACLGDWEWRIFSGQLYKIMIKGDDGEVEAVLPFRPNRAQRRFLKRLHYRNVILKARQLGFTTLIAILWLDHALFVGDQRCGMIAQTDDIAGVLFRDKVRFAYDNMPEGVRRGMPLKKATEEELLFEHNNSSIRVSTSMRGGTIHRLHVSEMGKIAAAFPKKAKEIVTGSLPTVPKTGVAVIESTAEGQDGEFFKIAFRAQGLFESGIHPNLRQNQFHFFPWWIEPHYSMDPEGVTITQKEHEYFATVEAYWNEAKRYLILQDAPLKLSARQRAWYVSQRDEEFSGDFEKMWQEYPSTPDECWQKSTEGTFLAAQLSKTRKDGRITTVPYVEGIPVNTFWDIGAGAGTGIWLHQWVGLQNRFIGYIEGWDEGYAHFVRTLRETGYIFGGMFLPHDANQKRQMKETIASPLSMLQELAPDWTFHIVPQVSTFQHGIDLLRQEFGTYWFDETNCKAGLIHLKEYRKRWNTRTQAWSSEPEKDTGHSEAADALRQHAQGFDPSLIRASRRPKRKAARRGGMAL
ncbi:hypothetical protein [Salipiger sp.]|uniref:hypothetical protein n=1 Tax=Salipiger sp. TaxID=2078585 RepID=UPI003A96BBF6